MILNLVQYTHLEKTYGYLPGASEANFAKLLGLDEAAYQDFKRDFDANARRAAQELLEDRSFAELVDRLPFQPGQTVLAVGDSLTDDWQSWLEIVRHLLDLCRPQDAIRIINAGVSSQTTAMALRRFVPLLTSQNPDWIVCFLGGNDATRIGPEPNKTQVSLDETIKNFEALRHLGATLTGAQWIWITPPTFDEERAAAFPGFQMGQSHWRNEDVIAIADYLRQQPEPVVDIQAVFGLPPDPNLQGPDGVHPSLAGQRAIARVFVERLTS